MSEEWIAVTSLEELSEGKSAKVAAGGDEVLLYRSAEGVFAVANRCTHQQGPLNQGVVKSGGSLLTVTCPLHGSTFGLRDGRVLRGPAQAPLSVYETRVSDGMIEVRRSDAG